MAERTPRDCFVGPVGEMWSGEIGSSQPKEQHPLWHLGQFPGGQVVEMGTDSKGWRKACVALQYVERDLFFVGHMRKVRN